MATPRRSPVPEPALGLVAVAAKLEATLPATRPITSAAATRAAILFVVIVRTSSGSIVLYF
jgi:hypothetical protein